MSVFGGRRDVGGRRCVTLVAGVVVAVVWVVQAAAPGLASASQQTFGYAGSQQSFQVPAGVTRVTIQAWGAQGANTGEPSGRGGFGASVTATVPVTPAETLAVFVGGSGNTQYSQSGWGYNGGGGGGGGGPSAAGGGASDVRQSGNALANRIVVAGGGGGGGTGANGRPGGDGDLYGGANGGQGTSPGGGGGTQTAGGGGATGVYQDAPNAAYSGAAGGPGSGGAGGNSGVGYYGGGGGGGYYGGGGGGGGWYDQPYNNVVGGGGGGAGSSFVEAAAISGTYGNGTQQGNGQVVITYAAASSTSVGSSPNPSTVGQSVTFTATVTGVSPTGTVNFKDGSTTIGTCNAQPVANTTATCTTTSLGFGSHSITAVYSGDSNNETSTSPALIQMVQASTTTGLGSSQNPSTFGQSVTFTATVTGASPGGTVNFEDGSTTIGTCGAQPLSGATATCTTSILGVGSHSLTGVYSGDANNGASTSPVLTQTVNQASTTTGLGSSLNPSTVGQSVTFTATVTGASPGGTVSFKDGAASIGSCGAQPLSGATATCTTSSLGAGSHGITAVYSGDTNNAASTSSALVQSVIAPALAPATITSGQGTGAGAPPPSTTTPAQASVTMHGSPSGRSGAASFTLSCAPQSGGCEVTGTLTTTETTSGHRIMALSASAKHKHQTVGVGTKTVTIAPGKTATITITLNPTGRKLLARFKKLPAQLSVSLTSNAQTSTIAAAKLTIEPPKPRAHKKH